MFSPGVAAAWVRGYPLFSGVCAPRTASTPQHWGRRACVSFIDLHSAVGVLALDKGLALVPEKTAVSFSACDFFL